MLREFHKKAEAVDASGNLNAADAWTVLDLLITKTTFAINLSLNLNANNVSSATPAASPQPSKTKPGNGKRDGKNNYTVNPGTAPGPGPGYGPPPGHSPGYGPPLQLRRLYPPPLAPSKRDRLKRGNLLRGTMLKTIVICRFQLTMPPLVKCSVSYAKGHILMRITVKSIRKRERKREFHLLRACAAVSAVSGLTRYRLKIKNREIHGTKTTK